jgi:heterodisulfide reductase subunit B2
MTDPEEIVRVDFAFRRELAARIEGNLASFCYQCGACVGDCPAVTFGPGGAAGVGAGEKASPAFNPREIMLKVLYGLEHELLGPASPLWSCTNCYNCHERCPQEVKPVEVIISLKNMLAERGAIPPGVDSVIHSFESTGRTTPVNAAVERNRAAYGLAPLSPVPMEEIQKLLVPAPGELPEEKGVVPSSELLAGTEREAPRMVEGTARFAFFPGCLIPTRHPAMEAAIRTTLPKVGIEIVDLEGTSCCPDPIYFKSKDKLAWLSVGARNLALAEEKHIDLFTNCSGCTATLSESYHLLKNPRLRERVNARLAGIGRKYVGTSRVRHVVTLLRDVAGYDAVRKSVVRPLHGLKVAIHYGCHLLKPSRIMQVDDPNDPSVLEDLVTALGATPVRHRNWYLCCGKACQGEDIPANMMNHLLSSVQQEEADVLCLICPTCFGQFDHGQLKVGQRFGADYHTPPVYFFQLLAFAQGVPYEKLGFDKQRFRPEVLRRYAEG